jgi:hypothetical protein
MADSNFSLLRNNHYLIELEGHAYRQSGALSWPEIPNLVKLQPVRASSAKSSAIGKANLAQIDGANGTAAWSLPRACDFVDLISHFSPSS